MQSETKKCKNCQKDFVIESDDFGFYEKIKVPPPTFCSDCRRQRRLSWKNTFNLYNRSCGLCGKNIVSNYSPDSSLIVYCPKCFWSDNWDPYKYGQDFNFSRPFFEQYMELNRKVPKIALVNDDGIASLNSPYCQDVAFSKNCYMVFISWKLENVMYSAFANKGHELCDCLCVQDFCEFMYESLFIDDCYKCRNVTYGSMLQDCDFCYDCRGCSNCFMCFGLRNKKYCYKNKEYPKEEYEKIIQSYLIHTRQGWQSTLDEYKKFISTFPHRFAMIRNSINCTGDDLSQSKNTQDSFFTPFSEDCRFISNGVIFKNCYDLSGGGEVQYSYEGITPDQSYGNLFSIFSWKDKEIIYCENCHSSSHLFGCASIKRGEYSILNKKYSKEEYFKLKEKIIEHMKKTEEWGEFFPSVYSHFAYNETEAMYLNPLSKKEAIALGLRWQDNFQKTLDKETMKQENVPESITDVPDSITNEILACDSCSRNYKITVQELIFYRKMNVPIPRFCFFCRNDARMKIRNPFNLWKRQCMCEKKNHDHNEKRCKVEFQTPYAPDRPEMIFCEQCYNKEIY